MKIRIGPWELILRRAPAKPIAKLRPDESLGRQKIATKGRNAL